MADFTASAAVAFFVFGAGHDGAVGVDAERTGTGRHDPKKIGFPYAAVMAKQKKHGDGSTPSGSSGGPPGKKQRRKARKNDKNQR